MHHTTIMLHANIDPTHLPIFTKNQPTAMDILHIIAKYVPSNATYAK